MVTDMDGILRRLKINELKAKIVLCELEQATLLKELGNAGTSNQRRAEIYRRGPRLKHERIEAVNDLNWLEAEERLRRPGQRPIYAIRETTTADL